MLGSKGQTSTGIGYVLLLTKRQLAIGRSREFSQKIKCISIVQIFITSIVIRIGFFQKKGPQAYRLPLHSGNIEKGGGVLFLSFHSCFFLETGYEVIDDDIPPRVLLINFDQIYAEGTHLLTLKHSGQQLRTVPNGIETIDQISRGQSSSHHHSLCLSAPSEYFHTLGGEDLCQSEPDYFLFAAGKVDLLVNRSAEE
jgi:hypothetical protein